MFDKKYIQEICGVNIYQRGVRLFDQEHVVNAVRTVDPDTHVITFSASVISSHNTNFYKATAIIAANKEWVLDAWCTCPYFTEYSRTCKHIAALLLEYIRYENEYAAEFDSQQTDNAVVLTDPNMSQLLNTLRNNDTYSSEDPVDIEIYMNMHHHSEDCLDAEFKIGRKDKRMYSVQNIEKLCQCIKDHEYFHYGKELEFTHSLQAFDPSVQPLLNFLLSLYDKDDSYVSSYNTYSYYSYSDTSPMRKTLSLKGRYLDDFFEAVKDEPLHFLILHNGGRETESVFHLTDEYPELHTSLKSCDDGYLLNYDRIQMYPGKQYFYLQDDEKQVFHRIQKDKKNSAFIQYLNEQKGEESFIGKSDLSTFSKYVYPLLSSKTKLDNSEGFDPYDYTALTPEFKIYLDSPQKDLITGKIFAVYGENEYDLLKGIQEENRRDTDLEKKMDQFFTHCFSSFNQKESRMDLFGEDETIYRFLTESIPAMQEKAEVFITDALKRFTVKPMSKVQTNISIHEDLLQLELVPEDMSTKQLSEILSRYEKKKKYYRLKDGSFINIDDTQAEELWNLKKTFNLTAQDIINGTKDLPKYRALYLEKISKERSFDLNYDDSFRNMLKKINDTDGKDHPIPEGLQTELRPYQIDGYHWLCALYDNGLAALLADEMGLGKTIEVIAFLGSIKDRKRCLIVCPASLIYNWSSEIQRFFPSLQTRMIQGSSDARKTQISESREEEILITSYDLLKRDIEIYSSLHFDVEIIDEAQYIKNFSTQAAHAVKTINSTFRIALTGTPIENKLSEMWSIFDYLLPGFFGAYQAFRRNYEVPIAREEDDFASRELTAMITPFVLRRLKKDVLKDLPDKLEQVYYAKLEDEQKEIYDARVQRLKLQVTKQSDQEFKENKIAVLAEITRLRQICADPGLIYENYKGNSSKKDLCIDLVANAVNEGHKVLLFSQFTSMLDEITDSLKENHIKYYLLEGSTPKLKRAQMVEAFQKDDVPVFCISLKAGGTGLNLTAADIVVHYDPWWNTAVENQASDRAHRIGQENVVSVCRLIMRDTIEERILNMQALKSELAEKILSGEGISSSKLSREELLSLL